VTNKELCWVQGDLQGFYELLHSKQTLSKDIIIIHFDIAVDDADINSF